MEPLPVGGREPPAWLVPQARALAEAQPRLHGQDPDPLLGELIVALTAALERGEVELSLQGPAPEGITTGLWPQAHRRALEDSRLAAEPHGPLVLVDGRLLWRRWQVQRLAVLEELLRRAVMVPPPASHAVGTLPQDMAHGLRRLDADQLRAVAAVQEHGLVLLEGGPGTGKTSTVAAMLAAVRYADPDARLHLAAPTGKAAARLRAATGAAYPCTTLHRLLESRGDGFGRDRRHPLALDLLVVDEVSMVDLALMAALLEALPPSCRLVLVGDPDQLPPVAPGPVLLELQRPELRKALGTAVVGLHTVYRNQGAIARVAEVLRRQSDDDPITALLPRLRALKRSDNLAWRESSPRQLPTEVHRRLTAHQRRLKELALLCRRDEPASVAALLAERDRLLVLSPVHHGRWGLEAIHRALLGERAGRTPADWPIGTPVLCCRNLPELGLANGDVGVLVDSGQGSAAGSDAGGGDRWRLLFGEGSPGRAGGEGGGEGPLWVHPAQLAGAVAPAFALTVHKAQGSEAEEVIVLLPARAHSDRRLLYTALTRARERALLITPQALPGGFNANET
jgi:exodeoxyribonuclease V alpha subunit